jgi:heat shock protein HslJ
MKKSIICGIVISIILMSCSKATNQWVGTYSGSGVTNTVNRVIIADAGNNTLQLQLQVNYLGAYYTYATVQHAAITAGNTATVNENGLVYGSTSTYHFVGTAALSGNNLTVTGIGTSTTDSNDVKRYYFTGSK